MPKAFKIIIALAALLMLAPAARVSEQGPQITGRLHVEGDRILDSSGRQVILRGVNAGGRSKLPPFYPFEPAPDFDAALNKYADIIQSLGANVVRLLVIWEAGEPARGQYDEDYLEICDKMVEAFAERDIRVFIDSHQDVYSRRFCGDGFPDWTLKEKYQDRPPRSDCRLWEVMYFSNPVASSFDRLWTNQDGIMDSYVAFFKMLALRYKDQPAVIGFEPINEPFPGWQGLINYSDWYNERLFYFYKQVADAVQSVDKDYLIFADICSMENQGSWSASRKKPDIHNLVFSPHYYDLGYLGLKSSPGGSIETMRRGLAKHIKWAKTWGTPAFITEFGVSMQRDDAADYLIKLYTVYDEMQLHGTIWEASMSETLWNYRRKLFLEPDGTVIPAAYNIDRPIPAAVSGKIEKFSFDAETGRFELVWEENPDVKADTLVYLPERIYKDGPKIEIKPRVEGKKYSFDKGRDMLSIAPLSKNITRTLLVGP